LGLWLVLRFNLGILAALLISNPAFAACGSAPVASLPITIVQDKLLIPASLNGSPEQLALDTGAGITVISTDAAGRLDIPHDYDRAAELGGVGGANSVLFIGQVNALDLAGVHLAHQLFPIIDLPLRTAEGTLVAGFLGADVLHQFDVDLNIPAGRLDLWKNTGCSTTTPPWQDDTPPIQFDLDAGNHILVPFKVDGVSLTAVLDTGAPWLSLTTRAAYRAGLTDDELDTDPAIHGTGVNNRNWTGHLHRFNDIQFAGASFAGLPAEIVPSTGISAYDGLGGADALIGLRLLRNARLWISYRSHTLYLLPSRSGVPD
jgi:predicted aspartyl protease